MKIDQSAELGGDVIRLTNGGGNFKSGLPRDRGRDFVAHMTPDEMKARTKRFALDILKVSDSIPKTTAGRAITSQLIRSGTSVAANYRAACLARSRAEFGAKIGIVLEEADESTFWLELLIDSNIYRGSELARLRKEAEELTKIMMASRKKVAERKF